VVANDKGQIISSTNKKFEGQPFTSIDKDTHLFSNSTGVANTNDSIFVVSSPIVGFNNKPGTLMFTYAVPNVNFK
jgi:hypothetical protein